MALREFELGDRFAIDNGDVALSGVQALLRILLDQLKADRRDGMNNAALVSGYRGSPLGGVDMVMNTNTAELDNNNISFIPGLNEDLAATAIWGSQLANKGEYDPLYDGVLGMWYGKAPGLERSGDAIRHANTCGVDPNGGVVMVVGDDPSSKSSTLASSSEPAMVHLATPILFPGSVQEVVDHGRWAFEMSRFTGLWSGLKIVTDVADGYSTIEVGPGRVRSERPEWELDGKPWKHQQQDRLVGPLAVAVEQEVNEQRLEAANVFTAHNNLNRVVFDSPGAKVGIVAGGKMYYDLRAALTRLGLDEENLKRAGIRIFKPTVLWPLEPTSARQFAQGLDTIIVVEEKRSFLELYLTEILYGMANPPRIIGKFDLDGQRLLPAYGELDTEIIIDRLRPVLTERFGTDIIAPAPAPRVLIPVTSTGSATAKKSGTEIKANRTAGFCSGCPHNTSTWVPEGSEAGGGIGCHGMAGSTPERKTVGITHMGGEGAQWVGAAPFVTMDHRFQNIGDGTYHHSGSLALRQAVAAGTNITYKILYNAAVAMTGGQMIDGQMQVPELTRSIDAEGVAKIIVVTDDPDKYPADAKFADGVDVWHRSRFDEAQRKLREIPGCTVLVYDQACAAELRRDRRRGKIVDPATRIFINELVCEGCGDCGLKSSCASVQPVETEFGRKTRIHQSSCNKDYTCVEGDCPAFVEVIADPNAVKKAPVAYDRIGADQLPEPENRIEEGEILMMGIGGTGVVTINQVLATAALVEGKVSHGLDQTGLSQKGGSVVSNLKIRRAEDIQAQDDSNKVGKLQANAYLAFDVLTAVNPTNLGKADPAKTVAVVSSSKFPTGQMVRNTKVLFPEIDRLRAMIDQVTVADKNVWFDAVSLSDALFRSHMPANVIVLGAAYQRGVIPLSAESIERAIDLNGVAVDTNIQAFRVGRMIAIDPTWIERLDIQKSGPSKSDRKRSRKADTLIGLVPDQSPQLNHLLGLRVPDLIDYQDATYAKRYVETVTEIRALDARIGDSTELTEAVARYLHKLMAYKDEYEVARLYRSPQFSEAVKAEFGEGAKLTYKLHPPTARRLGRKTKIGLGRSAEVAFAALARMKRVRGTGADLFGRTAHRQLERELIEEYLALLDTVAERLLDEMTPERYEWAVEVAELPDIIRGYDDIKEANVAEFRRRVAELVD